MSRFTNSRAAAATATRLAATVSVSLWCPSLVPLFALHPARRGSLCSQNLCSRPQACLHDRLPQAGGGKGEGKVSIERIHWRNGWLCGFPPSSHMVLPYHCLGTHSSRSPPTPGSCGDACTSGPKSNRPAKRTSRCTCDDTALLIIASGCGFSWASPECRG